MGRAGGRASASRRSCTRSATRAEVTPRIGEAGPDLAAGHRLDVVDDVADDHARIAVELVSKNDGIGVRMRRDARDALEAQSHYEPFRPRPICQRLSLGLLMDRRAAAEQGSGSRTPFETRRLQMQLCVMEERREGMAQ